MRQGADSIGGALVIVCGLILLAAGLWGRWGWEVAAIGIGGCMVTIALITQPTERTP